jgi:hypothetical protein
LNCSLLAAVAAVAEPTQATIKAELAVAVVS